MSEVNDVVIRVVETLIVSGVLALGGYWFAVLRLHRKTDKTRDIKLDKLVSYHEGIPADNFLGLPAVPGLNDRLTKQEIINGELAATQQEILEMVHTKNGKTIGQKVDNIEHIATRAEAAAAEASGKADQQQVKLDQLNQLVEDSLSLQEAHLDDGKKVMEIGVINDENEWEALREHGIPMPEYVYPPEDLAFSLEDLKKRKAKEE